MRLLTRSLGLLLLLLSLPAVAHEVRPQVWAESAMVKVRPETPPRLQPSLQLVAARNEFISFQVVLHGGATGLRNVSACLPGLQGARARIPESGVTHEGDQRPKYDDFLARPHRELWLYQSCASHGCSPDEPPPPENQPGQGWPSYMVDRPATKARGMQWVDFLEGASGELYYQTVGLLYTAWTTQFHFNGNGDGTLFYPGLPSIIGGSTPVLVPSIRVKRIRLGVQDYEWLKMVSDAGDPDFAREVARERIPAAWKVPDDGTAFERARLRLIRRYLELREHPPSR